MKYGEGSITEIQEYTGWEAKRGHCAFTVHFDGGVERSYDLATVQHTGLLSLPGESPARIRGLPRKKAPRAAFPSRCYAEIVRGEVGSARVSDAVTSAASADDDEADDDIGSGSVRDD